MLCHINEPGLEDTKVKKPTTCIKEFLIEHLLIQYCNFIVRWNVTTSLHVRVTWVIVLQVPDSV